MTTLYELLSRTNTMLPASQANFLLGDKEPALRAAFFAKGLAARTDASDAERVALYRRGMADKAAIVRAAALKAMRPLWPNVQSGLGDQVKKLAAGDEDERVRAAAAALLRIQTPK